MKMKMFFITKWLVLSFIFFGAPVHSSPGLIRIECSSPSGSKITGLFDGPSQRITFGSTVFNYLGRNDSGLGDKLIFQRKVDNDDYFLTLNIDASPVELVFMTENGFVKFNCQGFKV